MTTVYNKQHKIFTDKASNELLTNDFEEEADIEWWGANGSDSDYWICNKCDYLIDDTKEEMEMHVCKKKVKKI